ncbi:methyltransferase domain-containing protein [Variovorax sp. OV329]|uniref:methyltransferase domain-containing protein n=1 Tax=Variovorax sp. OV329 TaxID=1882825 RepID=UPI0008E9E916|nr:methyltransferase domain-containing protein [Variovorax sp. OV329]SFN03413.1 Predicted methyltransferase, contains TPR repeat [Variovorax sp. OV329]
MTQPPDAPTPQKQEQGFERARELFLQGLDLLSRARLEEAEQAFAGSLALLPHRISTLVNLAAVRVKLGWPDEAIEAADQVIALEPGNADAWFHRAESLVLADRRPEALESFAKAGQLQSAALPWFRHGQVLQSLEHDDEALDSYQRALTADATFAPAWTNAGNILRERSRLREAAHAFRQAIAHGGGDALNTYYLASVSGDAQAGAAPGQYVEGLFDSYAEGFDKHVVEVLGYRAHEVLASETVRLAPGRWFRSVLDLGCGTGLCGALLKTCSERITGVDLSAHMLAKAKQGGHYAQLAQQDIDGFLRQTDGRYDLVMAADVFIYVGDLAGVFAGVQRVADEGALFCFSLEELGADAAAEFELQPTLRFAHSERYARRLAAEHGFDWVHALRTPVRYDQRKPIDGLFVFLRKRAT